MKGRITVREFEAAQQKVVTAAQVLNASSEALKDYVGLVIEITNEIREQVEDAKHVNAIIERFIGRAVAGKAYNGHTLNITPSKKELLELETLIDERFEIFAKIRGLHNELYYTQAHDVAHEILDKIGRDPDLLRWLEAREKIREEVTEQSWTAST